MKISNLKNKQTSTEKFAKLVISTTKKKNIKGGSESAIIQDDIPL